MAVSLRMISMVARLGSVSVMPTMSIRSCRFASREAKALTAQKIVTKAFDRRPSHKYEMSEDDSGDMDDVEDKLQALHEEEQKWQKKVKYHKMRRQMTPPGAPVRSLTWDAMEQIRYLKREHPEEWTLERLAEGFSVSPDVISRVLRSKFNPSAVKKAKQDSKVMARFKQEALPPGTETRRDRPQLPGRSAPAVLPSGSTAGALVSSASASLLPVEAGSKLPSVTAGPSAVSVLPTERSVSPAVYSRHVSVAETTQEGSGTRNSDFDEEDEEWDSWDGTVFSEEELEEIMVSLKPSPVAQVGVEFFDSEGNFLYRI